MKSFIAKNSRWLDNILQQVPEVEQLEIKDGETFSMVDEKVTIVRYTSKTVSDKVKLDWENKKLHIFGYNKGERQLLADACQKELREFARRQITRDVEELTSILGVGFGKIAIREQKSRWGSCSSIGNLNFNWKIILAPASVYKYVIVHEVAHLIEHNHSAAFWQIVYDLHPNYKLDKKWLKKNGITLDIF